MKRENFSISSLSSLSSPAEEGGEGNKKKREREECVREHKKVSICCENFFGSSSSSDSVKYFL
jgi:hypothetical protein